MMDNKASADAKARAEQADTLHARIMNLPCPISDGTVDYFYKSNAIGAYKAGHRHARHAAADLAQLAMSAREELVRELAQELRNCAALLRHAMSAREELVRELAQELRNCAALLRHLGCWDDITVKNAEAVLAKSNE